MKRRLAVAAIAAMVCSEVSVARRRRRFERRCADLIARTRRAGEPYQEIRGA